MTAASYPFRPPEEFADAAAWVAADSSINGRRAAEIMAALLRVVAAYGGRCSWDPGDARNPFPILVWGAALDALPPGWPIFVVTVTDGEIYVETEVDS